MSLTLYYQGRVNISEVVRDVCKPDKPTIVRDVFMYKLVYSISPVVVQCA